MVITVESEGKDESEGDKHSDMVHMRSHSMLQQSMCVNQKHAAWCQKRCQACRSQAVARKAKTGRKEANMGNQCWCAQRVNELPTLHKALSSSERNRKKQNSPHFIVPVRFLGQEIISTNIFAWTRLIEFPSLSILAHNNESKINA